MYRMRYSYLFVFMVTAIVCLGQPQAMMAAGCGGGGCSSSSSDFLPALQLGNLEASVGQENGATRMMGSLTRSSQIEICIDGTWFRVNDTPNWDIASGDPVFTGTEGNYTAISFSVQNKNASKWYHFEVQAAGSWSTQAEAIEATNGNIPLVEVTRWEEQVGSMYEVEYDVLGRPERYESDNGFLKYGYADPCDPASRINRMWIGTNLSDYADRPTDPCDGRWIDVDYDATTGMLTHMKHGCGSCGVGERSYEYVASEANLAFQPDQNPAYDPNYRESSDPNVYEYNPMTDPNNYFASHYLLEQILAANGTDVLVTYDYDDRDRIEKKWLGDPTTGKQVLAHEHYEYDLFNPQDTSVQTHVQRQYVSNSQYRALIRLDHRNEGHMDQIEYHQLQTGDTFSGTYSLTTYEYEHDTYGRLTQIMTTLPKGNKIYREYNILHSGMTALKRAGFDGAPTTLDTYTYREIEGPSGNGSYLLTESHTSASGATTTYSYNNSRIQTRTEPAVTHWDGVSANQQQVVTYDYYDATKLLKSEIRKGADGELVQSYHWYDTHGNLILQIDGITPDAEPDANEYPDDFLNAHCSDPNDPNTCSRDTAMVTQYEYNVYNEPVKVIDASDRISKTYYSSSGAVTAEAVLDNSDQSYVISATCYAYNADGWRTMKAVVDADDRFTETALLADLDDWENRTLTWIIDEYRYDAYGRRTEVIADRYGEYLKTTYEYNNQSEIEKITYPDGHYKKTERDGRGLVKREVLGKGETEIAVTQYVYDLNGNLTKKVDPENVTHICEYDDFDRLVRVQQVKP